MTISGIQALQSDALGPKLRNAMDVIREFDEYLYAIVEEFEALAQSEGQPIPSEKQLQGAVFLDEFRKLQRKYDVKL